MYKPTNSFTTPFEILNPTIQKVGGRVVKTYPDHGERINVSFKTFGGTSSVVNGVVSVQDTANIETWYRPDITNDTHLKRLSDGKVYEVLGDPENIEMRNQYMKFKVSYSRGSSNG